MNDLTFSIVVPNSAQDVFDAIRDVKSWWLGEIRGSAAEKGDQFTYRYKDLHTSRQTVKELVPAKKVVWLVDEAVLSFAKNKTEWVGTEVVFEIKPAGDQTEIRFTHVGLTPSCECFKACEGGWSHHVKKNLVERLKGKNL